MPFLIKFFLSIKKSMVYETVIFVVYGGKSVIIRVVIDNFTLSNIA